MHQPTMESLMGRMDSKYALVVATAKRARMLTDGDESRVEGMTVDKIKPVSIAMEEIASGKIKVETTKGGIK